MNVDVQKILLTGEILHFFCTPALLLMYLCCISIRLSGPALGRPKKDPAESRKTTYTDGIDRIEVERGFSLAKRNYGLGLIRTRRDITTRCSILLSIIAMNIGKLSDVSLRDFLESIFQGTNWVFRMISGSHRYAN